MLKYFAVFALIASAAATPGFVQPLVKTIAAPVVHTYAATPIIKTVAAPVVHTYAAPAFVKTYAPAVSHQSHVQLHYRTPVVTPIVKTVVAAPVLPVVHAAHVVAAPFAHYGIH